MSQLLLTHGYFLYEDPKELQIMKPYPPLGILYLCSHLRQKGFDVEVFDSTFATPQELNGVLQTEVPSVLGIYANLMTRKKVIEIVAVAKEAGWKVVVGGPEPGAYINEYLNAGADIVVVGEGELTLEELLPVLEAGQDGALERVAGIAFKDETGRVRVTTPRAQISDLDAQPWPAREAIDISRYVETWRKAHGLGSLSFITARGCPYKCQWCSHQVFGLTHRRRDPLKVVDEVEWLCGRYHPDMFWVADDVFTIHHGWLRKYAAEMRRRGLRIPFECISRADRMNSEVADLLAELGCFRLWIGSESGSQRVLDKMQRGVRVEQVQSSVTLCKERGIQTGMFLMWGYEDEGLADIEETIAHVKRTDPDIFFTTVAYPIKGTPYYERAASSLVQLKPWHESSDREIAIRGRRPPEFYKCADQLLREEVRLARVHREQESVTSEQELVSRIATLRESLYGLANGVAS